MQRFFLTLILLGGLQAFSQSSDKLKLANLYFERAEYEKAVDFFEAFHDDQPENSSYYQRYVTCLLQLNNSAKAEKVIKKQIRKFPSILSYRADLADLYLKMKEPEKAKKEFEDAIRRLNADIYQISELGNTLMRMGQLDMALETYRKGRNLLKNNSLFISEVSQIYNQKKDKPNLIDELLNTIGYNEEMLPQVESSLQDFLSGRSDFDLLKSNLLKRIQKNPDKEVYTELLIWQFIEQKDFDLALMQTIALDKRQQGDGSRIFAFSRQCLNNEAYDVAINGFQHIIEKGNGNGLYMPAKLSLLETRNKKITKAVYSNDDLLHLEKDYELFLNEFGINPNTAFAGRDLAVLRARYMNKSEQAIKDLQDLIQLKGLTQEFSAECKIALADIYVTTGEMWEPAMLYGQVMTSFKDSPLGQEAKFKSARLEYYRGEFEMAKGELDVLKASTSQLIANDALNLSLLIADNTGLDTSTEALQLFSRADLLVYRNLFPEATLVLDSINKLFPGHSLSDEIWMLKGQMASKRNLFEEALADYQNVYERFQDDIWADDATFFAADILEKKLNDPQKAMKLYEQLITKYPGSLYVVEARKRFRSLRGDSAN